MIGGNCGVYEGTITLGGASLPSTNSDYDGADIYLVAKDTGAAHHIGGYRYSYSSGGYVLTQNYYGGKVLAGIYDVLYRRYWDRDYDTVTRTTSDKTHVSGYRYLLRDVVVGAGKNTLDLDIPVRRLSELPIIGRARRIKTAFPNDRIEALKGFKDEIRSAFDQLRDEYGTRTAEPEPADESEEGEAADFENQESES